MNTGYAWPMIHAAFGHLIPKFPSADAVHPVLIPKALPLPLSALGVDQVPYLWELWRTGCRPPLDSASQQAMTDREGFLSTAAVLLAMYEIAPAAWVAFSRSLWPSARLSWNGPEHPTASWVFGPERIKDQREWFESEQSDWCSARTQFGPMSCAIAKTWAAMKLHILRGRPETEGDVRGIVEQYFPGDMYESQILLAQAEHDRMQARINSNITRGVFVWE